MSSIWRWCVAFDNEELKYLTQSFLIDYENVTCREREGEKIERWEMKLKNFSYYRKRLDKTNFFLRNWVFTYSFVLFFVSYSLLWSLVNN